MGKRIDRKTLVILSLSVLILSIIFVHIYVRNEAPIYIYDYNGYFEKFKIIGYELLNNFKNGLTFLFNSIKFDDYNYLPVFFLFPMHYFFGDSRLSYILGIVIVYLVPIILLLYSFFTNYFKMEKDLLKRSLLLITISTFTIFWAPTLRGLPDIISIIPIILCIFLLKKESPLISKNKLIFIIIGLLAYIPFLFRRWMVYAIISFYVSIFIIDFVDWLKKYKRDMKVFINALKNYIIMGLSSITFALIIQLPLLKRILLENYSQAYSSYQFPFIEHALDFLGKNGALNIVVIIVGVFISFYKKKNIRLVTFCLINIFIFMFTFTRVQKMGLHHYLGISIPLLALLINGLIQLVDISKKEYTKKTLVVIFILVFMFNFYTTFINANRRIAFFTQEYTFNKFKYNNIDNFYALEKDLSSLIKEDLNNGKKTTFSVIASSEIISDSLVGTLGDDIVLNAIVYGSVIDSRDGINLNALLSNYLIVTEVPQATTNYNQQKTITEMNNYIINVENIGKAYKKILGPYILDNDLKVYIYEKERSFSFEEIDEFFKNFYKFYPEWEKKYNAFHKNISLSKLTLGKEIGKTRFYNDNTLHVFPGLTSTIIDIPWSYKSKQLDLEFYTEYYGNKYDGTQSNVNINLFLDNKFYHKTNVLYDKPNSLTIYTNEVKNIRIEIDSNGSLDSDYAFIKFKLK